LAGNETTTNFNYTVDYSGVTNPPALTLIWPQNNALVSGCNFTIQAQVDDATATVTASVTDTNGDTNIVPALVERNGAVWVKDLPLSSGTNIVTLTATNAAGLGIVTNFDVVQSAVSVTMDPLPDNELNQALVTVTGTVSDSSYNVWVNGVQATVSGDPTWEADNVPVNPTGTASFTVEAGMNLDSPLSGKTVALEQPSVVSVISQHTNYEDVLTVHNFCDGTDFISTYTEALDWTMGIGGDSWWFTDYFWSGETNGSETNLSAANPPAPPWLYATTQQPDYHYVPNGESETCDGLQSDSEITTQTAKTIIELAAGGPAQSGAAELVRLTVQVNSGDVPFPVSSARILGQAPTPMETNDEVGELYVSVPVGATENITPVVPGADNYTFNVQATNVTLQLAVDANRDGNITFDSQDQTTAANPYRFWLNNDYDGYDSSIEDYDDLDPSTGDDATNTTISCTRDLEDYTRLWLNTGGFVPQLESGEFIAALEWKSTTGNPQIRVFPAADWINGGATYLTDTNMAAAQLESPCGEAMQDVNGQETVTTNAPFLISTNYWYDWANGTATNFLLFDAVGHGSGQLVLAIYNSDGTVKLAESQPIYLDLQDVKEMYERWTVGDDPNTAPLTTASVVADPYSYDSTIPADNTYILFVHGWNLAPWEKDAFAETAFKRLYWQGYKGHFGEFRWPTGYGFTPIIGTITDARNYDNSESNAWASATGLLNKLNDLNTIYPGHVYLMAHSMGNVVAGEALNLASNQVVNTYVAMQAAVPAHCYDSTTANRVTPTTPDRYAYYWTDSSPSYFNSSAGAGTYVNFYNINDWALGWWNVDQNFKPDEGLAFPGYYYSTPSDTHPMGFYKIIGSDDINLFFPTNTYEIFAYADPAWSYALGAQADVNGRFSGNQVDLFSSPYGFGSEHNGHSAEFNSDNMNRAIFWNKLIEEMGLSQ
jgi:Alpha/beta hydrolase of unknown function (DUF900)